PPVAVAEMRSNEALRHLRKLDRLKKEGIVFDGDYLSTYRSRLVLDSTFLWGVDATRYIQKAVSSLPKDSFRLPSGSFANLDDFSDTFQGLWVAERLWLDEGVHKPA